MFSQRRRLTHHLTWIGLAALERTSTPMSLGTPESPPGQISCVRRNQATAGVI
ncbi:hypothetical protein LEMLEM_LOCUS11846 [Lemmus lemmus]